MSQSRERTSAAAKPSAQTLGRTRPTSMPDLMKIVNKGMDATPESNTFAYWMNKATKWRGQLAKAVESGNKEWTFVCAARTTKFIYEKVLQHPGLEEALSADQIRVLQNNGKSLLLEVQGLKKQLNEVYAQWRAIERVRHQQLERDLSKLQSVLRTEEGEDKPLPTVPHPEPDADSDGLHAIRTQALEVSRPGSPSVDGPLSPADLDRSHLMRAPSRSPSPPAFDGLFPPTYEEVMGDTIDIDGPLGGDGGGDYNIQVVEPDAFSKPVTPQISPEVPLPVYEKDPLADFTNRGRPRSRGSSVASKEEKKSRSRSANGELRVSNPTVSQEEQELNDIGDALSKAYKQLALLRKGGRRDLPDRIKGTIRDLKNLLV